jgi:DNA-binding transcriptional MerR regulator
MTITAAAARRMLRGQGMPLREIRAVLTADDPLFMRRLLELHRERLAERLEEEQRLVASIERSLAGEPGPVPSKTCRSSQPDRTPVARPHSCRGWGTRCAGIRSCEEVR